MNHIPTKIAIKPIKERDITTVNKLLQNNNWNASFNSIQISFQDEGAGGFLRIHGEDDRSDGSEINLDWGEWDSLVDAVNSVRHLWDPDFVMENKEKENKG